MVSNRYLVVHSIGKGGMGEVYLAVDQRLGSAVALKRTRFESDSELGNAFEREAKILARLRHPVLPKVIDHFNENEGQFLVMEHISGDDLAKRLESAAKPFPLSWVMFWADQLLDALNYLHSHEPPIIHRDIKPQNLKLTDDNHIVLLDFGLSKDFDSATTGGSSGVGSIVGYSPGFAPMEQVRGTGTDARSDLYSLSATLYQLLTNVVPADALTRADALIGGAADPAGPINKLNAEVTPEVSEVILRGMSIRQEERFSTAGEMQKALRRAFNHARSDGPTVPERPAPAPSASPNVVPVRVDTTPEPVQDTNSGSSTMDATLQMGSSELETVLKQSDVKTAIISGDQIDVVPEPAAQAPERAAEPEPQRTPPIAVDIDQPRAAAAAAGASATTAAAAPTAKKGKSKTGIIVVALLALLVLGGVAGGGGWYAYKTYAVKAATPSPTPAAATPTPAPTVEVAESNTSTDSNTDTAGANTNSVAVSDAPANPRSTPGPGRETPTKAGTNPTGPKPPAKAKSKDERTVILQ